jgi:hypothetical protein
MQKGNARVRNRKINLEVVGSAEWRLLEMHRGTWVGALSLGYLQWKNMLKELLLFVNEKATTVRLP